MRSVKLESTYKGTRILVGNEKRESINKMIDIVMSYDPEFLEVEMPAVNLTEVFADKVGTENNNLMFSVQDRGGRDLCLAPEYTAVIQKMAAETYRQEKDVKLFYIAECFRGEKPQRGRFRQFTQFGVEILNPTKPYNLAGLAAALVGVFTHEYTVNQGVTRGLGYYTAGTGFEIEASELGSSKQVVGGGTYDGGIGFAVGVDRLLELLQV